MNRRARLAWFLGSVTVAVAVAGMALTWLTQGAVLVPGMDASPSMVYFVGWLTFTGAGVLIAVRQPVNTVGWTLLGIGLVWELAGLSGVYRTAVLTGQAALPGGDWSAWVWEWSWLPGMALVPVLFLVFPDGRLPSRRWRPVVVTLLCASGLVLAAIAVRPGSLPNTPSLLNPVGVEGLGALAAVLETAGNFGFVVAGLVAVSAPMVRYRRSGLLERQQLKWFVFAAGVVVAGWLAGNVLQSTAMDADVLAQVRLLPLFLLPVAVAAAVLGYRLYDIDLVINKSIVYAAMAGLITVVYLAVVVGMGSLIGAREQTGVLLSITATALIAVAFTPVRVRLQQVANRLVYGQRASPYEVLASFAPRVTSTVGAGRGVGLDEMARTIAEAVGADSGEVWLRIGEELKPAARWPQTDAQAEVHLPAVHVGTGDGDATLRLPGASRAYPVRHNGRLLGALAVTPPRRHRLTPADDLLLTDLASAAWLVLDNAELIGQLRASRQRLVSAQDAERAHIERDLHDGAQQRLLELALALRTAHTQATAQGAEETAATIDTAQTLLRTALHELREFARGVHPAILTTQGLEQAVESLAERAPLPIVVHASGIGRFPAPVEATAYFVIAGALTNVIKHAHASQATVTASVADRRLHFAVTDDGVGGADPTCAGLEGLADRVATLGGRMHVTSLEGKGTHLVAELPCA